MDETRRQALKIAVIAPIVSGFRSDPPTGASVPAYWAAHNALCGLIIPVMEPAEAQRQIVAALRALADDYAKATVTVETVGLKVHLRSKDR